MTHQASDVEARLGGWLEEGPTSGPDAVLESALARTRSTAQQRVWRQRLNEPTRSPTMNGLLKIAAVVAIAIVLGAGALQLRPAISTVGVAPTPSPSPSLSPSPWPTATLLPDGSSLPAGSYVTNPFGGGGSSGMCVEPPQPGCTEQPADDGIAIAFTVPEGWNSTPPDGIGSANWFVTPDGAGLLFTRGGWLYEDPCHTDGGSATPTIAVGPAVDDLANALVAHPSLDVTTPSDVTLAGYDGKYLELKVPDDLSGCDHYRPWAPWYHAQNPGERWRVWILDVHGIRVVIQGMDYAATPSGLTTQLQLIVNSIGITFTPPPQASPSVGPSEVPAGSPIAWTTSS